MLTQSPRERFRILSGPTADRRAAFVDDVRAGLAATPKQLSCCYFYDGQGSELFDAICDLPEYYLTRAEAEILRAHAGAIAHALPAPVRLVELGSGTSMKTRLLIEACLRRQGSLEYVPLDICRAVLEDAAGQLLHDYPGLDVLAIAAEYEEGLHHLRNTGAGSQLILWLGSNVGNFHRDEAAAFLSRVRAILGEEDRLLLGIDLRKDRSLLEPAYDDAQGVTAEFNRNLLVRINRELGGNFDLSAFRHRAFYDETVGRVEMHLVSARPQHVRITALDLEVELAEGESIHTENSYKYSLAEIETLARAAGLHVESQWFDAARRFSVNLLAPSLT